jgi:hypothetical protein
MICSTPTHSHPPPPVSKLPNLPLFLSRRSSLLTGEGVGGGEHGIESYDRKKAWPSVIHSLLSASIYTISQGYGHRLRIKRLQRSWLLLRTLRQLTQPKCPSALPLSHSFFSLCGRGGLQENIAHGSFVGIGSCFVTSANTTEVSIICFTSLSLFLLSVWQGRIARKHCSWLLRWNWLLLCNVS